MSTALYRITSNEVVKISLKDQPFSGIDATYWAVLTDPTLPDGSDATQDEGGLRELGYSKISEPGSNNIRNATQLEIDTFEGFENEDNKLMDADRASHLLETHPSFRKVFKAFLKLVVINQLLEKSNVKQNEMIDKWNQYKTDLGNATSLAAIKTAVAALPDITSNLPETATLSQIATQLKALIDKDD